MDKLFLWGFVFAVIFCFTKMVKFLMKITPNLNELEKEDNNSDSEVSSASPKAQGAQPPKLRIVKNQNVLEGENKPKDKRVYLSTIAKTWLKDNFAYLNEAFNDAEDGIAILEATKLPKDKASWQYICEILKSADEISDFKISTEDVKIKI